MCKPRVRVLCAEESISHLSLKQTLSIPIRTMSFIKDSPSRSSSPSFSFSSYSAVPHVRVCVSPTGRPADRQCLIHTLARARTYVKTAFDVSSARSSNSSVVHHLLLRHRPMTAARPNAVSLSLSLSVYVCMSLATRR